MVSYHINKTVCAQRFFDGVTSGRSGANQQIVAARKPQRLPVVLSGEEIARFLKAVPGLCNRVALTTAYWAGLRVGEVVRLTAAAMDSSRMLIRIEQGKGGNDRYVMLSLRTAIGTAKLALCRALLAAPTLAPLPPENYRERTRRLTGHALDVCPHCGGATLEREPLLRRPQPQAPLWCDSS